MRGGGTKRGGTKGVGGGRKGELQIFMKIVYRYSFMMLSLRAMHGDITIIIIILTTIFHFLLCDFVLC